jgi:hypothetical protein
MLELETIPQETKTRLEQLGGRDLVIGIAPLLDAEALRTALDAVRGALTALSPRVSVVAVYTPKPGANLAAGDLGESDSLTLVSSPLFMPDPSTPLAQNLSAAYRSVAMIGDALKARACGVIASNAAATSPQRLLSLVQPVFEMNFDVAAPLYTHHKFQGLLNSSILYPLTRALYGKRIQNPLGPDFGFSQRIGQRLAQGFMSRGTPGQSSPIMWLATEAVRGGLPVCEARLGERRNPPVDWTNLSSLLVQILGPLFLEVESNAAFWQHVRGTQSVPVFGTAQTVSDETANVDVRNLIESFQLGFRNLQEIWSLVLPPATLVELKKLSVLGPDRFRLADASWVRIVYDFALAHRMRTINRDHLLRAMTPLYLAWAASYAAQVESAEPAAIEQRIEQLCMAYEAEKPYLLARWRWPDRFNP